MSTEPCSETFVPLRMAASSLGVPAAWLDAEAKQGRLPHLRAGRRLLFNVAQTERELIKRSEHAASGDPSERGPDEGGRHVQS